MFLLSQFLSTCLKAYDYSDVTTPPKKLHHIPYFKKLVYFIARRVVNSERKVKLFSCNKIQHGIELMINVYLVEQLKNLGVSWTS